MKFAGRQFWMALHRYAGLAMTFFIGVAALTGCALSFERPLDAWLNPDLFVAHGPGVADPLTAVAMLERAHPQLIVTDFPTRAEPGRNIRVGVKPRKGTKLSFDEVFLDGGDGHLVGTRRSGTGRDRQHLMHDVHELHCNLLVRAPGRWLMGGAAVLWFLSNLIGLYLTWPLRPPIWKTWRRNWTFRRASSLPRLLLDIHRASGLWLLLPLSVLALTSAALSFWDEALMPAVQRLSPPHASPFDGPVVGHPSPTPPDKRLIYAQALARADARRLGWQPAAYQYQPNRRLAGVRFSPTGQETYPGLGGIVYWFEVPTGRFVSEDNPYSDSAGYGFARAMYPLHTGQMIGIPGIMLDVVLGLVTLEQAGTGIYLWLKRRRMRHPVRRKPSSAPG